MRFLKRTVKAILLFSLIELPQFLNAPFLLAQEAAGKIVPGQVAEVSKTDLAAPTIMPDRIVLTWHGDPTTTQAVTWRTSTAVTKATAELAIADDGPKFQRFAVRFPATTQALRPI